ncbi:MAG: LacI family transcriptional regulator [Rhodobacterales bacterium]|nr:MAG: LacI family transcriptional regulator [Rhodobacterales bacterium]
MAKKKIYTMKDLSETIGISRPTLSRYFQNPDSVRPSTSQKIRERLEGVDYVYNFMATRQNRKSTELIGVIVPHLKDMFFAALLEAIERHARGLGYTIMTQSSDGDPRIEEHAVRKLRSMNADGAIVAPLGAASSAGLFQWACESLPVVFADAHPSGEMSCADFVGTDNSQSVATLVDYLCRAGDSPCVFLGMPPVNTNAFEREAAYVAQMRALGHEPHVIEPAGADMSWQFEAFGHGVMSHHFSQQRYTGATVLCANDRIAIGAIRAANEHGLFGTGGKTRGQLRIAGHDDHPLSRFMYPAITTVAQDVDGIARSAVELLVERIGGKRRGAPVRRLLPARLRLRESA